MKCQNALTGKNKKPSGTKSSEAPLNLFVIDKDCEKPRKEKAEIFRKLVARMLLTKKIARLDNATSISYLTKRLRDPDQSDWLKMVHLFKYVRGNKDPPLILIYDKSGMLKWYVDGSHTVHPNMRGTLGED